MSASGEATGLSEKYLKHRTYVDNCTSVFPLLKESYSGKFVELDFSQNLSLRPKDAVQSAHFSGKQFTLHCAVVEPVQYRYHYHISDDTKHDPFFVDFVVRDIIAKYNIKACVRYFLRNFWFSPNDSPSKNMKYVFYFI